MKNRQRKYILLSSISVMLYMLFLVCEGLGLITEEIHGILMILITIVYIFNLAVDKLLFTPLLFPNVYLMLFGLYQLKWRLGMTIMQIENKSIIVFAMILWYFVASFSPEVFKGMHLKEMDFEINHSRFKAIIYVLAPISVGLLFFEWTRAGGIPALRSDSETFRMQVSQNGIVHTLALMIKVLGMLILVYWFTRNKHQNKGIGLSIIFILSLVLMYGTANRGELMFIPVVGFLIYAAKNPPRLSMLFVCGILFISVLAIYPAVRGYQMYGKSYFAQYAVVSRYPMLAGCMPLYGTLAYNFEILNRVMQTFPSVVPYGWGQYSIFCYIPFFDLGKELWVVQNEVWNTGFYGALTSTFMGTWYADFGKLGCIIGTMFYCGMSVYLYRKLIIRKNYKSLVLYSYTFYMILVGAYSNAFSFVFVCYFCLIVFVLNFSENRKRKR